MFLCIIEGKFQDVIKILWIFSHEAKHIIYVKPDLNNARLEPNMEQLKNVDQYHNYAWTYEFHGSILQSTTFQRIDDSFNLICSTREIFNVLNKETPIHKSALKIV